MKFVSASKLKRAQDRIMAARPYAKRMLAVLNSLISRAADQEHPLLKRRGSEKVLLVVITGDIHASYAGTPWMSTDPSKKIVEFVGSSISSGTYKSLIQSQVKADATLSAVPGAAALAANIDTLFNAGPNNHLGFADSTKNGFVVVDLSDKEFVATSMPPAPAAVGGTASWDALADLPWPQGGQTAFKTYDDARPVFWRKLYPQGGTELYCGVAFDGRHRTAERLAMSVEHVFPADAIAETEPGCKDRSCAAPRVQRAMADLQNLWPALGRVNSSRSNSAPSRSASCGLSASSSIVNGSSTSQRMVASSLDKSRVPKPSRRRSPILPLTSAALAFNVSRSPYCCSHLTAVFGPTPGMPGMLSIESPTSAK